MNNADTVRQKMNFLVHERGVKGSFIARQIGISKTFLKQILDSERNFSPHNLEKAVEFLKKYTL